MSHNIGRHRAAGRYNAVSEIGQIVSHAGAPIAKGTAVIAASGGLIAAIAVPAQAADSATVVDSAPVQATSQAAPAAAVTAPSATSSSTQAVTAFGKLEVTPVAKPTGPTPAQLRARAEREQARQEAAAAERQREQEAAQQAQQEQAAPAAPERTQSSTASRSQERQAPAAAPAPAPKKAESAPAPSSNAGGVIAIAKQYIGTPYVYGGSTPAGFDCSGFTQYVFAKAGKSLPRVTTAQQAAATPVSDPQPGDLVFFGSPSYHVGIYLGDGMMIDAPRTGSSVSIRPVFSGVSGYGRV